MQRSYKQQDAPSGYQPPLPLGQYHSSQAKQQSQVNLISQLYNQNLARQLGRYAPTLIARSPYHYEFPENRSSRPIHKVSAEPIMKLPMLRVPNPKPHRYSYPQQTPRNLSQSLMNEKESQTLEVPVRSEARMPRSPRQPADYSKLPQVVPMALKQFKEIQIRKNSMISPTSSLVTQIGYSLMAGQLVNGSTKTNQDCIIVDPEAAIYGVADGHGQNGDKVSGFLKIWIPKTFQNLLPVGVQQSAGSGVRDAFVRAFRQVNADLWAAPFDSNLAGSTLVCVWFSSSNKIVSANVGDSRAVMGRKLDHEWSAIPLTRDHKPSVEEEAKRIIQSGGRIAHQIDNYGRQVGPLRVWLKNAQAPGLAMTRSFGDKVGAQAGVTAVPEVIEHTVTKNDRFVVVASDGIWEHITNAEVIKLVGQGYDAGLTAQKISDRLLHLAIETWKQHSLARDDISCLVIFLN